MPVDRPLFTDKEGRLILSKDGQLGCCCGGFYAEFDVIVDAVEQEPYATAPPGYPESAGRDGYSFGASFIELGASGGNVASFGIYINYQYENNIDLRVSWSCFATDRPDTFLPAAPFGSSHAIKLHVVRAVGTANAILTASVDGVDLPTISFQISGGTSPLPQIDFVTYGAIYGGSQTNRTLSNLKIGTTLGGSEIYSHLSDYAISHPEATDDFINQALTPFVF